METLHWRGKNSKLAIFPPDSCGTILLVKREQCLGIQDLEDALKVCFLDQADTKAKKMPKFVFNFYFLSCASASAVSNESIA